VVVNNKGVKVANKDYEIDGVDVTQALDYVPNDKDRKLVKYMERMFDASKRARAHKVPRWRRNEELYNGEFLKPFNLPKYKTRIVANTIHSTVETIYSILTDRFPKVDIMPKTEEQVDGARKSQEAVESEMRKNKALRAINGMKRDALVYGNGFLKLTYKEGKVDYSVPDIYTVFVDPLATNIDDAKCVIFAQPTYLKDVREMFERGKNVKSEGKLDEYKSFIRAGGESSGVGQATTASGGASGTSSETGVASSDVRTDYMSLSPTSDMDDKEMYGGQVLLKEAWHHMDGKLYLTTWAGKVLLQHVEAPTDFIPVVTFKNYSDEHRFWGKGEPEIVEPLAVGTAILLSQSLDNVIYHGNPAWVMSKSLAKTPGNRPSDKPGQVFWTNGPHEQINRLPAGNISSSNLPLAQYMMQLTDTISGIHDITQGRNPSGVTAAKAISALQEASQQIIRAKEREVGADAMIDVYKQTLSILVNNYEQGIMIRREGNSGYEFEELQPYDLDADMDYKYVPGSTMPESRASRIDQALEYIQLGLITPEQFWRWHEKDISRDILEEMVEQKQAQINAQQQDMDIINNSTDENEIYEALLRQKAQMGEVPEEQGE
jgi:hypothetical protein